MSDAWISHFYQPPRLGDLVGQVWLVFGYDKQGWIVPTRSWTEWYRRPEPPAEINEVR